MCQLSPNLPSPARFGGLLIALTLAVGSYAQPASAAAELEVSAIGDRIAVRAEGVSLRQVLAEISRRSAVRVSWLASGGEEPVAVALPARPVREVLEHLLARRNHLLRVDREGQSTSRITAWVGSEIPGAAQPALHPAARPATGHQAKPVPTAVVAEGIEDLVYNASATADPSTIVAMAESLAAPPPDVAAALLGASEHEPAAALALEQLAAESSDPVLQDFAQQALEEIELRARLGGSSESERADQQTFGLDGEPAQS